MSLQIETLTYNPFAVNTFLIIAENKDCIIVDPACYDENEEQDLIQFLENNQLRPIEIICTHGHLDHITGNNFLKSRFDIPLKMHKESLPFIRYAPKQARIYGLEMDEQILPDEYIQEGIAVKINGEELEVFYTPGHVDGSICLYYKKGNWVIVGDVLFRDSIGRTDLPSGDFNLLAESIRQKLYVLPNDTKVYPGHGPSTSIGYEKEKNPFVKALF